MHRAVGQLPAADRTAGAVPGSGEAAADLSGGTTPDPGKPVRLEKPMLRGMQSPFTIQPAHHRFGERYVTFARI